MTPSDVDLTSAHFTFVARIHHHKYSRLRAEAHLKAALRLSTQIQSFKVVTRAAKTGQDFGSAQALDNLAKSAFTLRNPRRSGALGSDRKPAEFFV